MTASKDGRTERLPEPERLKAGKAFHKAVQEDWGATAEPLGTTDSEVQVTKLSKEPGRVDVLVPVEDGSLVAVVEVKNTGWGGMTDAAVRRNVRRHISQVWDHIESQLEAGKEVCPGNVFPKVPDDPGRTKFIEALFGDAGIVVVWQT